MMHSHSFSDKLTLKVVELARFGRRLNGFVAYILATLVAGAALLVRIFALGMDAPSPYLPFIYAIIICSLVFGRYTGIYVTVLTALCATAKMTPLPAGSKAAAMITLDLKLSQVLTFIILGFFLSTVIEGLNNLYDRHKAADERTQVLVLDLNHRVKNHLTALGGLIMLSRKKADEFGKQVLSTVANRLLVLARLYDLLALDKANASAKVSAKAFIGSLTQNLKDSVIGERPIQIFCTVEDGEIDTARAVPIGLLVNELATNSLKHAFSDEESGSITITFSKEGKEHVLTVADDGTMPFLPKAKGTGTQLIEMLSGQLNGTVEVQTERGHRTIIRFPG